MNKIKLMEILARIPLFKDLTPPEREVVQKMVINIKRYPQGKVFIKEGAHEPFFYILLAGKAEVSHRAHKIGELIPGQFIGEVGFICKEPRSATVTASTDIALMLINAEDFRRLPARIRESIKDRIISGLVDRVSGMNDNTIRYEDEIDKLREKVDEYENDPRFKGRASIIDTAARENTKSSKRNKNQPPSRSVNHADVNSDAEANIDNNSDSNVNADISAEANTENLTKSSQTDEQNSPEQPSDAADDVLHNS